VRTICRLEPRDGAERNLDAGGVRPDDRLRAGHECVQYLRHTGCTRMLERGVPFPVVSEVMGWSASTAIRMAKRYGHIGSAARRETVGKLSSTTMCEAQGAQKWAQSRQDKPEEIR